MSKCENKFLTQVDLARQGKILTGNTACFDGKIQAGLPFSAYTSGVDNSTIRLINTISAETAVFSGNNTTTLFDLANPASSNYDAIFSGFTASGYTWSNPLYSATTSGLTLPITPTSAITQTVGPFWTPISTGMTGDNPIITQYSGYSIEYSFFSVGGELSGSSVTVYSATTGLTTAFRLNYSAGSLDYTGPVDYLRSREDATIDNRLTTKKLRVTQGASASTIGYVLVQNDPLGSAVWAPASAVTSGGTDIYINSAATTSTVGGITAGSTFPAPGKTMQEMWDLLLYPYQPPAFTSFNQGGLLSEYELGQTISIGAQTFTWGTSNSSNVADGIPGSIEIKEADPVTTIGNSLTNDGTESIVLTNAMGQNTIGSKLLYTIFGENTIGGTFSKTLSRTWKVQWYYGKNANTSITSGQMTALSGNDLVTGVVNAYVTQPATGGAQYMYWCVPDILAQPTDIRDSVAGCFGTNIPYTTLADIPITNSFGVGVNYKIYRSVNPTSAEFNTWLCS